MSKPNYEEIIRQDTETLKKMQQHHQDDQKWRTVIVGLPIIRKLLNGEDVELNDFHINLIPDDVLFNNRQDVAVLFGDDVFTMERIFAARKLLGGRTDERSITVKRGAARRP
jgi:hypothetical protein